MISSYISGDLHMPMKFSLLKYLNPIFVETGTARGDGVEKALNTRFNKIYSIELKEEFYERCTRRFEKHIQKGKVEILLGDSTIRLADILKKIDSRATFWLDAHYSGARSARGNEDVPLMRELDLISKHHIKNHTILIDDVRCFGRRGNVDWSNISLDGVIKALKKINPNYSISYENGYVQNDVIVADIQRFNWYKILSKPEEALALLRSKIKSFLKMLINR